METKKTNWRQALDLLNDNIHIQQNEIEFDEMVHIHDVTTFNKNGIEVPEDLIDYDDDNIDCSDAPEISLEDIDAGKLIRVLPAQINVEPEIQEWIVNSNIDYNVLLSKLLKDFYITVQLVGR